VAVGWSLVAGRWSLVAGRWSLVAVEKRGTACEANHMPNVEILSKDFPY